MQEHVKLLVSLNTIVVAMLALAIGLVGGIFLLEWEWTKSDIWVWKNLGKLGTRHLGSKARVRSRYGGVTRHSVRAEVGARLARSPPCSWFEALL